jgi:hypothetical protein
MPIFLDTRGKTSLGIAICARCSEKFSRDDLYPDPNFPGLMVCREDRDVLDPYRLPARQADQVAMEWTRPDVDVVVGPQVIPINQPQAQLAANAIGNPLPIALDNPITALIPPNAWAAGITYTLGAQVTPTLAVGYDAAGEDIYVFTCIVNGVSGLTPPKWTNAQGTQIWDNTVLWFNSGLYLP